MPVTVQHIALLLKEMDKVNKLDLEETVEKKYGKIVKALNDKVGDLVENVTPEDDYKKLAKAVVDTVKEVLKANEEAKKNRGPMFKFKGNNEATEKEVVAFIKKHLPSGGHGDISQSLNDVVLGRGKATGISGVLHASAGTGQSGKGCTLFFKRGDVPEIVAIGQHIKVPKGQDPKYIIHFSSISGLKEGQEATLD